jgi:hypothetical protein
MRQYLAFSFAGLLFIQQALGGIIVMRRAPAAAPAGGPITITQTCAHTAYVATATCALTSPVAGKQLVLWMHGNDAGALAAPTGCASSWTLLAADNTTTFQRVYTATATGGTCNITVTTGNALGVIAHELSASSITSDATPAFEQIWPPCASCTNPSITTATDDALVLSWARHSVLVTVSAPYTQEYSGQGANWGLYFAAGSYIMETAGATSMPYTSATGDGVGATVAFR